MIHYAPAHDHPLCGTESLTTVFTDDPATVAGCVDCLELAAEDLELAAWPRGGQRALGATVSTASRRSPPRAASSGGASSVRPARTAGRRGGKSETKITRHGAALLDRRSRRAITGKSGSEKTEGTDPAVPDRSTIQDRRRK